MDNVCCLLYPCILKYPPPPLKFKIISSNIAPSSSTKNTAISLD